MVRYTVVCSYMPTHVHAYAVIVLILKVMLKFRTKCCQYS